MAGAFVLVLAQGEAAAYIGPGAGFAVAGSVFVVAGSFLLAFGAVLLWPFKAAVKVVIRRGKAPGKARRVVVLGGDVAHPAKSATTGLLVGLQHLGHDCAE